MATHRNESLQESGVIEFERAVLGMAMYEPEFCRRVVADIDADDFSDPFHIRVYRAIHDDHYAGGPADYVSVYSRLTANPTDRGLKFEQIARLYDRVLVSHLDFFLEQIKQASRRRRVLAMLGESMATLGQSDAELIAQVQNMNSETLALIARSNRVEQVGDILVETLKAIENGGKGKYIRTGLASLDNVVGGFFPGQLWVIAGRTSMGKSSLAQSLILNLCAQGHSAAYYSVEGTNDELTQRLLAIESGSKIQHMIQGNITDSEATRISAAAGRLAKMKLYPLDGEYLWHKIRAKIQLAKIRDPNLSVVFVDHLQLIRQPGYRNRWDEVAEITRDLKALSLKLGITCVLVCQINRETEKRSNHMPTNADLRDSGSVEQDADNILLLYRAHYYDKTKDPTSASICISKQRNGPTGAITCSFSPATLKFED